MLEVGRWPAIVGLIPSERSSGARRRLGAISKQGNVFLRTLLVEAAQSAVQYDAEFGKEYRHRCHSKPKGVAKVAAARKLAVRLYWMLKTQRPYCCGQNTEGSRVILGRRKPDRALEWAPSHPAQGGMFAEAIMAAVPGRIDG